ncbi:MAG: hypothetical protein ACKVOT_05370 [Polaromonas sp.]
MTSFVHLDYSTQHPGVARVESAIEAAQQARRSFSGSRGLSTLLLSAMAAAVMVVAYQVMDTVAEGHMLVVWMALWAVAFVVLAVFASATRTLAVSIISGLDSWSRAVADAKADQRLWAIARTDARVMNDLQSAMTRYEGELDNSRIPVAGSAAPFTTAPNALKFGTSMLRAYQRNYI